MRILGFSLLGSSCPYGEQYPCFLGQHFDVEACKQLSRYGSLCISEDEGTEETFSGLRVE